MDVRLTLIDCDEAGDYVVPNVLSRRDLVSRPDNMDMYYTQTCIILQKSSYAFNIKNINAPSPNNFAGYLFAKITDCFLCPGNQQLMQMWRKRRASPSRKNSIFAYNYANKKGA